MCVINWFIQNSNQSVSSMKETSKMQTVIELLGVECQQLFCCDGEYKWATGQSNTPGLGTSILGRIANAAELALGNRRREDQLMLSCNSVIALCVFCQNILVIWLFIALRRAMCRKIKIACSDNRCCGKHFTTCFVSEMYNPWCAVTFKWFCRVYVVSPIIHTLSARKQ